MEHLIQLNLHGDGERAEKVISPKPERRDRESPAPRFKRLQRTSMGAFVLSMPDFVAHVERL